VRWRTAHSAPVTNSTLLMAGRRPNSATAQGRPAIMTTRCRS
jgi:hypothetical protein